MGHQVTPDEFIKIVREQYFTSGNFNGLHLSGTHPQWVAPAKNLLRLGTIEIIAEEDFPNIHVRPWPNQRSNDDQARDIEAAGAGQGYGVCIYPTTKDLRDSHLPETYQDQPFRRLIAEGRGCLECAFFRLDVLEPYRNDPRFHFDYGDFGVSLSITDAAFSDPGEFESEKTGVNHCGFAYAFPIDMQKPIVRRAAVFLKDLAQLTAEHQQRWKTYEVPEIEGLKPHPIWMKRQMGYFTEDIGPFERVILELGALNQLNERAFGKALFRNVERPRDFGWILRPSQREYDQFIHTLDKLLAENLQHETLDTMGAPRKDEEDQTMGTITRFDRVLSKAHISETNRKEVLQPFRDIRKARQPQAHAVVTNITDDTLINQQVEILEKVGKSLSDLRAFWQKHPNNKGWKSNFGTDPNHYFRL